MNKRLDSRFSDFKNAEIEPARQIIFAALAGWMNRKQQEVIEYLLEENRVLKQQFNATGQKLNNIQRPTLRSQVTDTTFPAGADVSASLTEWVYDPFTSLLQHKRFDDYDELTNPTAQVSFDYRDNGFLLTRTDQRGVVTTYTPDSLQRLQSIAYSDGTPTVALTYNRSSRRLTQSDASGSRNFTYTDAGLLDTEVYTSGSLSGFTIDHNYAANDDYGGVELHDGGTSIYLASADYDAFDRARTITFGSDTFTYNYDSTNGRLDYITIAPDGTPRFEHDYSFDTYGRLTGLAFEQGGTTHSNWQYTTFDPMDRRTTVTNSDGDTWSYGYNLRGELDDAEKRTGVTTDVVPGYLWDYEYDDIGNRDTVTRNGREDAYTPNALNQYDAIALAPFTTMMGESTADISIDGTPAQTDGEHFAVEGEFTDSPSPELAIFTLTGTLAGAGDDGLDAVADFEVEAFYPGNTFTPQYDAAGNLTSNGQWIFAYNGENRLIHAWTLPVAVAAGVTPQRISFNYDGEGRRFTKTVYALVGDPAAYVGISPTSDTWTITESRRFIYDGWNLIVELDDADSIIQSYLWGMDISGTWQGAGGVGGLLAIQEPSDNLLFLAFDGNGNVTALIDESTNSVVAEYEYSPFGELLRATGPKANANPFRFSTKYFDSETELMYFGFRYYDVLSGRWLRRDPIWEAGGFNLYGFVGNDTINFYDALGRERTWVNLDSGYRLAVDSFNEGGESAFQIHVYDRRGGEVAVLDRRGNYQARHRGSTLLRPSELPRDVRAEVRRQYRSEIRRRRPNIGGGRANLIAITLTAAIFFANEADGTNAAVEEAIRRDLRRLASSLESGCDQRVVDGIVQELGLLYAELAGSDLPARAALLGNVLGDDFEDAYDEVFAGTTATIPEVAQEPEPQDIPPRSEAERGGYSQMGNRRLYSNGDREMLIDGEWVPVGNREWHGSQR